MYHPLPRAWLLATNKIEVQFESASDHKGGHGSGFWVRNGDDLVFVTNRHVIDIQYKHPKYRGHGCVLSSIHILTFDANGRSARQMVAHGVIFIHKNPEIDLALILVTGVLNPDNISVEPANVEVIADARFLRTNLAWGAQVSFSSFQPWRDTQTERPILRTGILASDPAHPFVSDKVGRAHVHLLEAFSFAGSSGSPVFANAFGIPLGPGLSGGGFRPARIIGVMAGHLDNKDSEADALYKAHTGLSYCHRSDLLLAMLSGSEPLERSNFFARSGAKSVSDPAEPRSRPQ